MRKRRAAKASANSERLVAVFEAVRPWYPRSRVCLFDALALMRFMLQADAKPNLVIGVRTKPFTVEINDGKAATAAKAMKKGVIAEITGKLRHDRWKDKASGRWTGKVFIAVDPEGGAVRSVGMAQGADRSKAA
jgi:hypothetical protein